MSIMFIGVVINGPSVIGSYSLLESKFIVWNDYISNW